MVFEAASQYEEVVAVSSDHRYMRSGFAFLTEGMETRGIQLALTSKSVYSHSRSVSPLMADQSTPPGEKQQFYGLQGQMWVVLDHKMGPCDGSGGRLETNCKIAHSYCICVCTVILSSQVFLLTSCESPARMFVNRS